MKAMKDFEAPCETGSIIVLLVTLDCHKALLQTSVMTSLAEKLHYLTGSHLFSVPNSDRLV